MSLPDRPSSRSSLTTANTSPIFPSRPFSRADIDIVATFSCCSNPPAEERWEKDVNDWIKAGPTEFGAIYAVEAGCADVWLYLTDDNQLIGYGSLGTETIQVDDDSEEVICLIPFVGISTGFQGVPDHPREARFARRILSGLIEKVRKDGEFTDLFLYVDPDNPAFLHFYPKFGFTEFDRVTDEGREWVLMQKSLLT